MVKKLVLWVLVLALLIPFTSAIDTEINVKTIPATEVQITISDYNSDSFSVLEGGKFKAIADEYGDVQFIFKSNVEEFNLAIYVKDSDGEKIIPAERISGHIAGNSLDLELAPSWFEFIETPSNESNITEVVEEVVEGEASEEIIVEEEGEIAKAPVTGFAIFGEGGLLSSNAFYYIIGGLVLLAIAFFGTRIIKSKIGKTKEIRVKKLSEVNGAKKEKIDDFKDVIDDAEKKIKEAQDEIKKLKERGQEGLKAKKQAKKDHLKKKIENYEKELIKLRQEDKED